MRRIYTIYDRENKQYFAGFSKGEPTWAKNIENAHPYYTQEEADEEYEQVKELGFDVEVG